MVAIVEVPAVRHSRGNSAGLDALQDPDPPPVDLVTPVASMPEGVGVKAPTCGRVAFPGKVPFEEDSRRKASWVEKAPIPMIPPVVVARVRMWVQRIVRARDWSSA